MKKAIKITLAVLLILIAGIGVYTWSLFGPLVKGALSVEKLDESFYYMEYKGDDGFAELIGQGGGRSSGELAGYVISFLSKGFYTPPEPTPATVEYGCSALTVRTPEDGVLMGRNYDWRTATGEPDVTGIILHTIPKNGYETITTFDGNFFGFGDGWRPEGFVNQFMALTSLFFALDGINEKGLAIADLMAGDQAETHQNTGKPSLTTTSAICYLLKNAADVDEALELLWGIDMHSDIGSAHHYAISDASGRSVVVEYVDNEMVVVESPAAANHYLCEAKRNVGLSAGDHRYEELCDRFDQAGGTMEEERLKDAIQSVSHPGTCWTLMMDLTHPSVTYCFKRHFDHPLRFELVRKGH